MRSTRELKRNAREAMRGNYGLLIGVNVAVNALGFVGSMISGKLFPGTSVLDLVLSQVFVTILMLVFSVFTAGASYLNLNVARGRAGFFGDLGYFFKHHPDRVIIATLGLAGLELLASIPMNCYIYMAEPGAGTQGMVDWMINYTILMLAAGILEILLSMPFAMIYYILSDHPEMTGFEAMKESMRMMKGRTGNYLLMQLSFIPLMILSIFTLYIALLWIVPYMEMSRAMFYRDILGELDNVPSAYGNEAAGVPIWEEDNQKDDQSEA